MGKIFSGASRVIFWLGKPTKEVILLMKCLDELQAEVVTVHQAGTQVDGTTWQRLWSCWQTRLLSSNSDVVARQREGLQVLLKRSWFERVWILQEVHNARPAVVCCGLLSVPAHVFAPSPLLLQQSPSQHVQSILDTILRPGNPSHQVPGPLHSLIDLLARFNNCKATDPRDMVFALIGMSLDPSDHELLRPNYTQPLSLVVWNIIRYWLRWTTTSVHQILDFLNDFKIIRATFIILPTDPTGMREMLKVPSLPDTIECTRDVSLFVLEQIRQEFVEEKKVFHIELDRLQSRLKPDVLAYNTKEDRALRVVTWSRDRQSIKLLIIKEAKEALGILALHKCKHIFDFVGYRSLSVGPEAYDDALPEAAEEVYWYMVELLINKGANVNAHGGKYGTTALQSACMSGHKHMVQMLLDRGADINAQGDFYGSALQAGSQGGHEQVVRILLDKGAEINGQEGHYGTALQAASYFGHEQIVRILLDEGADVDARGGHYGSALQAASYYGREKVMQILLDEGADVNAQGGVYGTALHMASANGCERIMQMLLDRGADVNAQAGCYVTVLQAASVNGHKQAVQFLLKYRATREY